MVDTNATIIVIVNNNDRIIKLIKDDLKKSFLSGKAITNSNSLSPFSLTNNGDLYLFKFSRLVYSFEPTFVAKSPLKNSVLKRNVNISITQFSL